ncbi:MAG TPA: chorismate mutase [Candidatus Dormibacteraeota bacterium]
MPVRGIRGATTAVVNTPEAITEATQELLVELTRLNDLDKDEICFAYFTTTHDLTAEFPAYAARRLGWLEVPLLCGHDMDVPLPNPRAVPMCIRILLLYNTAKPQSAMRFAYLRGARAIKADLDTLKGTAIP